MKTKFIILTIFFAFVIPPLMTKEISIRRLAPLRGDENEIFEQTLQQKVQLLAGEYQIRIGEANRSTYYTVEIFYKTYPNYPPDIYALIYHSQTGDMIDAFSTTTDFSLLEGITLDKTEFDTSERVDEFIKGLKITLEVNQAREKINYNIIEHYLNKPIAKEKKLLTKRLDKEKEDNKIFSILEENQVTTASRTRESIMDVPASIMIITAKEIKNRGYTSLDELFKDLPGFDYIGTQGWHHNTLYQRGYRTPFTSRTLLMIDGQVENDLWAQAATITRQYPLTNIEKVEVIYGPSSAVYGPNAFQGIVNIITRDGKEKKKDGYSGRVSFQYGSGKSWSIDGGGTAKIGDFYLAISAKKHEGNDATQNVSGYGFNSTYWLSHPTVWGPMLYYGDGGRPFGASSDPVNDWGTIINGSFKTMKIGLHIWNMYEGFGPYYAGDKAQSTAMWGKSSMNFYIENNWQILSNLSSYSLVSFRQTRIYGNWSEAVDDSEPGRELYSQLSYTGWNSINKSLLVNQNFEFQMGRAAKVITGLKGEFKNLTRLYDVPGYYWSSSFSSVDYLNPNANPIIEKQFPDGYSITPSSSPFLLKGPEPKAEMPKENTIGTLDRGGFLLTIFEIDKFRFSPGIRYDVNSIYGQSINPRITGVYRLNSDQSFKLLYGEAFNEPPPLQLFGGWSGRTSDLDLKPEKVRTVEGIYIQKTKTTRNELSLYYSRYENVIKESAENAGRRRIYGFEYKLRWQIKNFIEDSPAMNLFAYYTFTEALSNIYYDHNLSQWLEGETILGKYEYLYNNSIALPRKEKYVRLGDIARDKINLGFNLPIKDILIFNLRGNYVGRREFYQRNPLRNDAPLPEVNTDSILRRIQKERDRTIAPYFIFDTGITVEFANYGYLTFKILNCLNQFYLHPGVESANSGNYYYARSSGFQASVIPQPGRVFILNLTLNF